MGPVISARRARHSQLHRNRQKRRPAVSGGGPAEGDGYFIKPTVIAEFHSRARIFQEQILGPVLAVTRREISIMLWIWRTIPITGSPALSTPTTKPKPKSAQRLFSSATYIQSQMHRRDGRAPSVRRLQHVRYRFQSRRTRLPAPVCPGKSIAEKSLAALGVLIFTPSRASEPPRAGHAATMSRTRGGGASWTGDSIGDPWCPLPDLNRHNPFGSTDFKSVVSTSSTKRAPGTAVWPFIA